MKCSRAPKVAFVVAVCSLGCLACDKGNEGASTPPAVTASASAPPPPPIASASAAPSASATAAKDDNEHRHVGLAGLLLKGAYDMPLTDTQKAALDKAEAQLYPANSPSPWTAVKTFQTDLVSGIRADKIDMTAVKNDEAAFDKAVAAGQVAEADALNTLHGALDPTARQTLVDRVKAKRATHDHDDHDMHDMKAGNANTADGGWADMEKHHLDKLAADLGLDDAQKAQVAALMAKDSNMTPAAIKARRDALQKRIDALLVEFPKDTFDAKKTDLSAPPGKTPHDMLDHTATFAAGVLPILKPAQVTSFADRTERMGNRPEHYFEDVEKRPGMGPAGSAGPDTTPGSHAPPK